MTDHVGPDDAARRSWSELQPDVVGVTVDHPVDLRGRRGAADRVGGGARTPCGCWAASMPPSCIRQVLTEAPWVDVIVRGEGEEIMVALAEAVRDGRWPADRAQDQGPRLPRRRRDRRHPGRAAPSRTWTASTPTGRSWTGTIHLHPAGRAGRHPQHGARLSLHLLASAASGSSGATTACATPRRWWTRSSGWSTTIGVGFFILADEEPTINKKKFVEFCQELIDRGLNKRVKWGINTRVTDIYRDRDLLKFYREAGLVHVSLGTEAAAQLKLDLFNKETTVAENKEAIRLLREADIFTEAQFIVGLDNETPETLEETFQMAWDWQPDLANWSMYTPWPFTPLFQEITRSGRGLRLLEIQLRDADHEARRDDAGRACWTA